MNITLINPTTLEEFWNWYPNHVGFYELRNGEIFEMQPIGSHEQVRGNDLLKSKVFPELNLTAQQIFDSAD